jgi:formylglycine-generating enzyme required for sulfatase activity
MVVSSDSTTVHAGSRFQAGERPMRGSDWQLEELLAVDGFGELWKARHAGGLDAPPAVLRLVYRPDLVAALMAQKHRVQMLISVTSHPGLAALHGLQFVDDFACLESACPAGERLDLFIQERWKNRGETWVQDVTRWLREITKPLGVLHRFLPPVVHRNLSAEKVTVRATDNEVPEFVLTDWLIVGLSAAAPVNGVAYHVSPGQLRGDAADPRDDVFALGVLWHQMLTGKFGTKKPGGTQWRRKLADQGMTEAQLELMQSCFAEDPAQRPSDADILGRRLGELLQQPETSPTNSAQPAEENPPPAMPSIFDLIGAPSPKLGASPVLTPTDPAPPPPPAEPAAPSSSTRRRRGQTVKNLLDRLGQSAPELTKSITNTIGMKLMLIPPGSFQMGSPADETGHRENEGPRHEVSIAKPFYMGVHPVTQREYREIMGENPSQFHGAAEGGADHPVERITWLQAIEYCLRLSDLPAEKEAGRIYALPTEAEWEYCCRAGTATPFSFGVKLSARQANFDGNFPYGDGAKGRALGRTTKVECYPANNFGLCDMHGNVWEWCADWYDAACYPATSRRDPPGPKRGQLRVIRGGSWRNHAVTCRAAYRNALAPHLRDMYTGFRVVMRPTGRA